MRTFKRFLMAFSLCLPTMLMAQEINLLLEEQLEEMTTDDGVANWDDLLEELSQPIDLNNANKEQYDNEIQYLSQGVRTSFEFKLLPFHAA